MCVYFAFGEKKGKESYAHGESYARSHTLQCYHKTHRPGVVVSLGKKTHNLYSTYQPEPRILAD